MRGIDWQKTQSSIVPAPPNLVLVEVGSDGEVKFIPIAYLEFRSVWLGMLGGSETGGWATYLYSFAKMPRTTTLPLDSLNWYFARARFDPEYCGVDSRVLGFALSDDPTPWAGLLEEWNQTAGLREAKRKKQREYYQRRRRTLSPQQGASLEPPL